MSEYIFSSQERDAEFERLRLIQDSFDEKTQKHLLKAGLKEGMDCLEVGVGAGSIALWIQSQVGSEGSLLGVDLDTTFLDNEDMTLMQGDILELDIKQQFDLIHLRYVLIHNKSSSDILSKLIKLLKPSGKLVIEEPDFTLAKWIDAEDKPACKRVNSAICKMYEEKGLIAHYGSVAHLQLQELGLRIEENNPYLHLCSGNESVAKLMASSTMVLSKLYIDTKLCSQDDIEKYIKACQNPDSLAVYYATIAITASKNDEVDVKSPVNMREDGFYVVHKDDEIRTCFSLMHTLRPQYDKESFVLQVKEQMAAGYRMVCLLSQGEYVCLAGYRVLRNLAWGKYLYVDDLVTIEGKRSQGYGEKMLSYLIDIAKKEKCQQLHLDSGVQRFNAHKFYHREGFKISSHHFSLLLE